MGKPPASPASREITAASETECVFLIGAYQRFACTIGTCLRACGACV